MRYGRLVVGAAVLLAAAGCGLSGGNKGQVCDDTKAAVTEYVKQVKSIPATDAAQWRQATDKLALRLDKLSRTADDGQLRKALSEQAAKLKAAAPAVGTGDTAALTGSLTELPDRIGRACA